MRDLKGNVYEANNGDKIKERGMAEEKRTEGTRLVYERE